MPQTARNWDIYHSKTCIKGLDQYDSKDGSSHISNSADERNTAQNNRRNSVKFQVHISRRLAGIHTGREDDPADGAEDSHHHITGGNDPFGI